ncbi:MAG: hydrogenase maturation protease [Zoogloeaceae bacterium]|jgi:hydrogenase maturation protease|nr:hydrogenase maturation protease [Zoogloeaceae bacterium]
MPAPRLIFAWGNLSRGDDALGPALAEHLAQAQPRHPEWGGVDTLTDYQLQPEHALDLAGRERVLFVDASVACAPPYAFGAVQPAPGFGYTTHAMKPEALLAVFRQVTGQTPPPAWLLTVRGDAFELGAPLSPQARRHLRAAIEFAETLLGGEWERLG